MSTAAPATGHGVAYETGRSLQATLWRYPEWWSLAVCGGAWLALIAAGHWQAGSLPASLAGMHAGHHPVSATPVSARAQPTAVELGMWTVMVAAMMIPVVIGSIRVTAARSLWRRRHRAIAMFLVGYLVAWSGMGVCLAMVRAFAPSALDSPFAPGAALLLAAVWQLTPAKRRALLACHVTRPLAPHGWRSWRDATQFGLAIGQSCMSSCWALMLVCGLLAHDVWAMACLGSLSLLERTVPQATPRATCGLLLVGGTLLVGLALR